MNRRTFTTGLGAALAMGMPFAAAAATLVGKQTTQSALLAALPRPGPGDWLRLTVGSGMLYGKQFGFGAEATQDGTPLLFVETQIGAASGACNPNTTRKTYLRTAHFGALLSEYAVLASVARSGNMITRWADVADGEPISPRDAHLRLLDAPYLYDERPLVIESVTPASLQVAGRTHATTRVVGSFEGRAHEARLQRIELWHTPSVPFGVARYHATVRDLDPFELSVRSFGGGYKPDLGLSLQAIRVLTSSGGAAVMPG
jgi:hypothetical protein